MRRFVLVFAFTEDRKQLILINKTHPPYQAGLMNGVGGGIDPEDAKDGLPDQYWAALREFEEEAGVELAPCDIEEFGTMYADGDWICYLFRVFDDKVLEATTKTEEKIAVIDINTIDYSKCVDKLDFIIPMALTKSGDFKYSNIECF